MKREMSDRLINAVDEYKATKSEEAFNIIYEESKRYIYSSINNITKGSDHAKEISEDLFIETMTTISQKINQNKETGAFLVWAGVIAGNNAKQYFKKANQSIEFLRTEEEEKAHAYDMDDEAFIPENLLDSREKVRLIREIIEKELKPIEYKCVALYYYNDMKQADIAELLGMSENTIKTHLYRAKAKIKAAVLKMEKEKGTKLYSFAPFMLILFREQIVATLVPESCKQVVWQRCAVYMNGLAGAQAATNSVTSSAANSSASSTSSIGKKIAAASLKTKVIGGLVGLGTVGVIAGTVAGYFQSHKSYIPEGAGYFNGHYYYVQEMQDTTWEEAEEYYESLGGHLLTISSQEENDYAFQYMNKSGYTSAYFGLSDVETEGEWKWVTGEKLTYINWADGEPNVDGYIENYVMFYEMFTDGKWNDCGPDSIAHTNVYIGEWDESKKN